MDPFGRAVRDHHRDERTEPLRQRDGAETVDHPIEAFYFGFDAGSAEGEWLTARLAGPLLDVGAGAGRHALHFQEHYEVVAIEVSEHLIETMRERGVDDARQVDMFSLRETFERDRYRSVLANGTQVGLAKSVAGLRELLGDLAFVTTPDATAVIDSYDPDVAATADLLGYRSDPARGLASRVMHFEYEGDVGETLLFRLFGPARVREAARGTGWTVESVVRPADGNDCYYKAALTKR